LTIFQLLLVTAQLDHLLVLNVKYEDNRSLNTQDIQLESFLAPGFEPRTDKVLNLLVPSQLDHPMVLYVKFDENRPVNTGDIQH